MKWKKIGMIFNDMRGLFHYAQAPQALVFDSFVRVYFSSRELDEQGKYLSNIAFVDFNKNFTKTLRLALPKSVIKLGDLGCFDEHGIFPMNVIRYGEQIYAYTCGWSRRSSVSADASIGFAVSNDAGLTFSKMGDGPILSSSLNEPFLVGDPFVKIINNIGHMWYIYGVDWVLNPAEKEPQRVYKIGHAVSNDGISWTRGGKQVIDDKLNKSECQAMPSVVQIKDIYHMFFCYRQAINFRENKNNSYRIGYAYSRDLQTWTRNDDNVGIDVSENGWDSDMLCYPHVFECDGEIYMLYNGNNFGRNGFGLAVLEEM